MKLAIYHRDFCSPRTLPRDGARQFAQGLAAGCAAGGIDVTLLCEGTKDQSGPKDGFTVECFSEMPAGFPFLVPQDLQAFVRDRLTDAVVLMIGMFVPNHYPLSRLLRKLAIPYVLSPLDPYNPAVFRQRAHLKWPYWYACERSVLRSASAIQLLDIRQDMFLRQLGVRTPVFETPVGVLESHLPTDEMKWRSEGVPRLICLGRIDPINKGLDLLIDAVAEVKKSCPVELVIQGPGYGTEQMAGLVRQVERLRLQDTVTFRPPDYTREGSAILSEHDLYCEPSRYTGFGIAAMEAMLVGRPVLVSVDQGISPHVVASNGGVVVRLSPPEIARGILSLIEQRPFWKELGLRGRRYVLENLQWEPIALRTIQDLRSILPAAGIPENSRTNLTRRAS